MDYQPRLRALAFAVSLPILLVSQEASAQDKTAAWNASKTMQEAARSASELKPILAQMKVKEWLAAGASPTFQTQWDAANEQLQSIEIESQHIPQYADNLNDVLQALFRVEAFYSLTSSLGDAVRRYQNPALADLLAGMLNDGSSSLRKLQKFTLDLANEREQQFRIADQEAQRCRGNLARERK